MNFYHAIFIRFRNLSNISCPSDLEQSFKYTNIRNGFSHNFPPFDISIHLSIFILQVTWVKTPPPEVYLEHLKKLTPKNIIDNIIILSYYLEIK